MSDITHAVPFVTGPPARGSSLTDPRSARLRAPVAVEPVFRYRLSHHPIRLAPGGDKSAKLALAWRDVAGAWLLCALVAVVALTLSQLD